MKRLLALILLSLPLFASAAELTGGVISGTPRTIVPALPNQRVAFAPDIACSRTDPTDLITCMEEARNDARRLVNSLNWAVSPAQVSGREASDFERTFRLQLEPIRLDFTDLYFEIYVESVRVHDRQQWTSAQHLDVAIDATEAGLIAAVSGSQDHIDFHLYFHETSTSIPVVAATFRRVLIAAGGSGGAGGVPDAPANAATASRYELCVPASIGNPSWCDAQAGGAEDDVARSDAGRALTIANQNDRAITANQGRLTALEDKSFAADLAVWPPNVQQHTGFRRDFQSTLAGLDPALATEAGSTGTRFANNFQILTRLANDTVVQLHTQSWSFTVDDRQTIPWEVSADEFNAIGATSATTGIEVWGEFRAIYGGGVDELRGRTNRFFIDFGEEADWPATRGDAQTAVDQAVDIQYAEVATASALTSRLTAQGTSTKPLLIRLTAAVTATVGGVQRNYPDDQVLFLKPGATTPRPFFALPQPGTGGSGSGGGGPLVVTMQFTAAAVALARNSWVELATLTIPAARGGSPIALFFNGTVDRTSGSGNISLRVTKNGTAIRSENDELEVSGGVEHAQVVEILADTPSSAADTVYRVEINHNSANLVGTVRDREFLALAGGDGQSEAEVNALIQTALAPFSTVTLEPGGIPGNDFPETIYATFTDKQTTKTITGVRLIISGQAAALHATTPVSNIEAGADKGGVLRFDYSTGVADTIGGNIVSTDESVSAEFTFTYSDGTTDLHRVPFLVHNPTFEAMTLSRGQTQAVTGIANARAAAVPGPVIIVSTITAFDATDDQFENSSGAAVTVPNGVIVTLTQAVYDAAVADATFTPNANAIFLTR